MLSLLVFTRLLRAVPPPLANLPLVPVSLLFLDSSAEQPKYAQTALSADLPCPLNKAVLVTGL
jgi:hypothetical protein